MVRDKLTVIDEIGCSCIVERLVDQEGQLEVDSLSHWKPVEMPQHRSDMVTSTSAGDESRSCVLHRLEAPEQTVCNATEQRITIVRMTSNKTLHERPCCIDGQ